MEPKLTDGPNGTIAKAEPPTKGQRFIFENKHNGPTGFGIRVTAAGGKAFIMQYRVGKKETRKTIGEWPTWSLSDAKHHAEKMKVFVSRGIDPNTSPDAYIPSSYEFIERMNDSDKNKKANMCIDEYNDLLNSIQLATERLSELLFQIKKEAK